MGLTKRQKSLKRWTKQKWRTPSGKKKFRDWRSLCSVKDNKKT